MKMPTAGDVVQIDLMDHGLGGNVPLVFRAYGRVREVTAREVILDYWHYSPAGEVDARTHDDNVEHARIVRGAIMGWRKLH